MLSTTDKPAPLLPAKRTLVLRSVSAHGVMLLMMSVSVLGSWSCSDEEEATPNTDCDPLFCLQAPASTCEGGVLRSWQVPGQCSSEGECVYVPTDTTCPAGCDETGCLAELCNDVECSDPPANFCNGTILNTFAQTGACSAGSCIYDLTQVDCTEGGGRCEQNQCVGGEQDPCRDVQCTGPPIDECADENTVRTFAAEGVCTDGDCAYASQEVDCPAGFVCFGAECVRDNPCNGVVCETPPETTCIDNRLFIWQAPGSCDGGNCRWRETIVDCAETGGTCVDTACVAGPDPCDSIVCDTPPPASCTGSLALRYEPNGVCTRGECTWEPIEEDCDATGLRCINGECVDECAGLVCDSPPPTRCAGNILRQWQESGTCSEGICTYEPIETNCADAGQFCVDGACISI